MVRPSKPGDGNGGGGQPSAAPIVGVLSAATIVGWGLLIVGGAAFGAGAIGGALGLVGEGLAVGGVGFGLVVGVVGGAILLGGSGSGSSGSSESSAGGSGSSGSSGGGSEGGPEGGPGCFVEGTPVLTAEGLVPIESIRAGDKVYTLDLNRGEPVINRVLKTFTSQRDEVIELDFGKETISSTPQHRFYTGEWIAAQELRVGNALLNRQGQHIELKRIQRKKSAGQYVFNLGVEGVPNYFVGELKLLVHNVKIQSPPDGGSGGGRDP